jgi:mitogen-activated protein kinase 15
MADAIIDPAVLHQFDICHKVGQGAYGIVWKAIHRKQGRTVALKKCFDAFRCDVDAQRTFREVMYLRALSCVRGDDVNTEEESKKEGKVLRRGHPNIVKLINVIRADNDRDLYITFEYSETDLSHVIKARILGPTVRIDFRDSCVGPSYSTYASNTLCIIDKSTAHSIHYLPATESPKISSQCGTIA